MCAPPVRTRMRSRQILRVRDPYFHRKLLPRRPHKWEGKHTIDDSCSPRSLASPRKLPTTAFLEAGRSLDKYIQNRLLTMGGVEVVKRTALAALYAGVALPLTLIQTATTAFDSDFTRCRDKAQKAGVLLAEILQKEVQGKRPVVLVSATTIFLPLQ